MVPTAVKTTEVREPGTHAEITCKVYLLLPHFASPSMFSHLALLCFHFLTPTSSLAVLINIRGIILAGIRNQHLQLLNQLEGPAFCFRFMDLTPEIRNRVYCSLVPAGWQIAVTPLLRPEHRSSWCNELPGYPAISSVSRQIRAESLPLVYSRCVFTIAFVAKQDLPQARRIKSERNTKIGEHLRAWAKYLSTPHLKWLRKVQRTIPCQGPTKQRQPTDGEAQIHAVQRPFYS